MKVYALLMPRVLANHFKTTAKNPRWTRKR